jgi:hypothetical protein
MLYVLQIDVRIDGVERDNQDTPNTQYCVGYHDLEDCNICQPLASK